MGGFSFLNRNSSRTTRNDVFNLHNQRQSRRSTRQRGTESRFRTQSVRQPNFTANPSGSGAHTTANRRGQTETTRRQRTQTVNLDGQKVEPVYTVQPVVDGMGSRNVPRRTTAVRNRRTSTPTRQASARLVQPAPVQVARHERIRTYAR